MEMKSHKRHPVCGVDLCYHAKGRIQKTQQKRIRRIRIRKRSIMFANMGCCFLHVNLPDTHIQKYTAYNHIVL